MLFLLQEDDWSAVWWERPRGSPVRVRQRIFLYIYTHIYVYKINQSIIEYTYLSHQLRPLRQPLAVLNIIPQVLDKIRIRVVRHDYTPRAVDGRDETGETGASTELEHGFVFQEDIRVLLEVGGDGAAGVPEVVALVVA